MIWTIWLEEQTILYQDIYDQFMLYNYAKNSNFHLCVASLRDALLGTIFDLISLGTTHNKCSV